MPGGVRGETREGKVLDVDRRILRMLSASPARLQAIDRILAGGPPPPPVKMRPGVVLEMIVSSGETGAERTALDWAIENGVAHGGFCRPGRKSREGGRVPEEYAVKPIGRGKIAPDFIWKNVECADATLIVTRELKIPCSSRCGEVMAASRFARVYGKPWLHLAGMAKGQEHGRRLVEFCAEHQVRILNVVGEPVLRWLDVTLFVMAALEGLRGEDPLGERKGSSIGDGWAGVSEQKKSPDGPGR